MALEPMASLPKLGDAFLVASPYDLAAAWGGHDDDDDNSYITSEGFQNGTKISYIFIYFSLFDLQHSIYIVYIDIYNS